MTQHLVQSQTKLDKVMDSKKFDDIVTAILAGKYSWACVLILRCAGYNPLHYIPYRTYNRLMKNNSQRTSLNELQEHHRNENQQSLPSKSSKTSLNKSPYKISDLSYLEVASVQDRKINGGHQFYLANDWELVIDC